MNSLSKSRFTLGMLGGMSFEATSLYYQKVNQGIRQKLGALHSAELLIHSVDFHNIVELQKKGDWQQAGEVLAQNARKLEDAGANAMMICAVTMHLVAPQVRNAVNIPFIDILEETAQQLKQNQRIKPLLIATRYSMENGFYHEAMSKHGIDIQTPDLADREEIHRIIFEELSCGVIVESSRAFLKNVIATGHERGCDSVIFGCTEICLILGDQELELKPFDSTDIHINAAVDLLVSNTSTTVST